MKFFMCTAVVEKKFSKKLYYRNKNFVSEDLQDNDWQKVKELLMLF